jgi:GTP-binding protein
VEGYFAAGRDIALVVQIIDMRHKPTADDRNMIRFLYDSGVPFIVVMTKADKLNKSEYAAQTETIGGIMAEFEGVKLYPFSALSGTGAAEIEAAIMESVGN